MKYALALIAGIWFVDGLALLVAPGPVMSRLREVVTLSPRILQWEALVAVLGLLLLLGTQHLRYPLLWVVVGTVMIAKGLFLSLGPEPLRQRVLDWCLQREEVDYRFLGLGLLALALLLIHALGWTS